MNPQIIAQLVAALPDNVLQQALTLKQQGGGAGMGAPGQDPLSGLGMDDPENAPKSWKDITIDQLGDQRPPLADKDFLVPKQGLQALDGMPTDQGAPEYGSPGGF